MKVFRCACGQFIFFQNVACVACKRELGFFPESLLLSAIEATNSGLYIAVGQDGPIRRYKKCANYAQNSVCNWLVPEEEKGETLCQSCRLSQIIPDLTVNENVDLWGTAELAKRRLLYSLLNLQLPLAGKACDPLHGLAFRFLSDGVSADGTVTKVFTGHADGIITVNIKEADDAYREKARHAMNEPYRTLLGHFRHEVGHYYWDRLVRDKDNLDQYRSIFGDERAEYAEALRVYYKNGAPSDWQENYISAYATAHPWEDWAETWAHFLHMQDTLEVANEFGMQGKRFHADCGQLKSGSREATSDKFSEMVTTWTEFVVALNSINRSMGHQDLYPFVLSNTVINKLRFVSEVIYRSQKPMSVENMSLKKNAVAG